MDDVPKYRAVHDRLRAARGHARDHACAHCGAPARDWALTGEAKWTDPRPYTDDLDAYTPLCRACHHALDRGWWRCPHGPDAERNAHGACLACFRERDNERKRERYRTRYSTDAEYVAARNARARERYARKKAELDNDADDVS